MNECAQRCARACSSARSGRVRAAGELGACPAVAASASLVEGSQVEVQHATSGAWFEASVLAELEKKNVGRGVLEEMQKVAAANASASVLAELEKKNKELSKEIDRGTSKLEETIVENNLLKEI